jgi:hypothetical protein
LRGISPHGAARLEAITRARGSPREATPLELGLLDGGLEDAGAELAGVGSAVRVSAFGSLAALVQLVARSSAPQTAADRKIVHRCLAGADVGVTTTVWPVHARQMSRP